MLFQKIGFLIHYSSQKLFLHNARTFCVIYDKNFHYFRNRSEYKNTVVHLSNDLNESKVAGPGCSFLLKDYNIEMDSYFSHLNLRENVMKLSAQQVKDLLFLMANMKIDTSKYGVILKYLDEKCALSVERWPLDLIFYVLDAWFIIWGNKVFKRHYYSAITSLWGRRMNKCSKHNLILMLYFIGVSKVAPPFLMEMIEDKMESFATDFSDEEWAIACLSFFKTSKKLTTNSLLNLSSKAVERLLEKNDRFNAVSILKCLRLSKYYDVDVYEKVKNYVLKEYHNLNFVECTNFLATFSSLNNYDKLLFDTLESQSITALQSENMNLTDVKAHPSIRCRVKDIARFIWALSSMGHNIKSETIDFIDEIIKQRLELNEFDSQWDTLIDCLQSMAINGYYHEDFISEVLNTPTLKKLYYINKIKPKYQLYFVQRSVLIEVPEFELNMKTLYYPIPKNLEKDITERKGFKDLVAILKNTSIDFTCCYIMPHIMISGIIIGTKKVKSKKPEKFLHPYKRYIENGTFSKQAEEVIQMHQELICLEILDPTVCVNGGNQPHGLMKTKIRQLKCLKFKVVTLTPSQIKDLSNVRLDEDINKIIAAAK